MLKPAPPVLRRQRQIRRNPREQAPPGEHGAGVHERRREGVADERLAEQFRDSGRRASRTRALLMRRLPQRGFFD